MRAILFLFISTCMIASAQAGDTTRQKSSLPSVLVKRTDGTQVNIQEFAKTGKITVISFWATWCTPCIKELDNILDVYDEWQSKYGMELIAVSMDDSRNSPKVKPISNSRGWPYTILLDENQDLARAMNVNNPPLTVLLDQNGNIVYMHNGYTEGVEFELEKEIQKLVKKP